MKPIILYHANCSDGFAAAFAAYLKFGYDATYIPVQYGHPPPKLDPGYEVFILDFSYKPAELLEMGRRALRVTVLDHHKTAQEDLTLKAFLPVLMANGGDERTDMEPNVSGFQRVRNIYIQFDLTKSGAVLAWEHFWPTYEVPDFFRYIQDRDLWQWKLPRSREFSYALRSYDQDFGVWEHLSGHKNCDPTYHHRILGTVDGLKDEGTAMLRIVNQQVDQIVKGRRMTWFSAALNSIASGPNLPPHSEPPNYWVAPRVNATCFISEVCERMLQLEPRAQFVAAYFDTADGKRVYSLRSRPDFDCSVVAKAFGGGGHPQAAGFSVNAPQ